MAPLEIVRSTGDTVTLKRLVRAGAATSLNEEGIPLLKILYERGDIATVRQLWPIRKPGAHLNADQKAKIMADLKSGRDEALFFALQEGWDFGIQTFDQDRTILDHAVRSHNRFLSNCLVILGISPVRRGSDGLSAVGIAFEETHEQILEIFRKKLTPDVWLTECKRLFEMAVRTDNAPLLRGLLTPPGEIPPYKMIVSETDWIWTHALSEDKGAVLQVFLDIAHRSDSAYHLALQKKLAQVWIESYEQQKKGCMRPFYDHPSRLYRRINGMDLVQYGFFKQSLAALEVALTPLPGPSETLEDSFVFRVLNSPQGAISEAIRQMVRNSLKREAPDSLLSNPLNIVSAIFDKNPLNFCNIIGQGFDFEKLSSYERDIIKDFFLRWGDSTMMGLWERLGYILDCDMSLGKIPFLLDCIEHRSIEDLTKPVFKDILGEVFDAYVNKALESRLTIETLRFFIVDLAVSPSVIVQSLIQLGQSHQELPINVQLCELPTKILENPDLRAAFLVDIEKLNELFLFKYIGKIKRGRLTYQHPPILTEFMKSFWKMLRVLSPTYTGYMDPKIVFEGLGVSNPIQRPIPDLITVLVPWVFPIDTLDGGLSVLEYLTFLGYRSTDINASSVLEATAKWHPNPQALARSDLGRQILKGLTTHRNNSGIEFLLAHGANPFLAGRPGYLCSFELDREPAYIALRNTLEQEIVQGRIANSGYFLRRKSAEQKMAYLVSKVSILVSSLNEFSDNLLPCSYLLYLYQQRTITKHGDQATNALRQKRIRIESGLARRVTPEVLTRIQTLLTDCGFPEIPHV